MPQKYYEGQEFHNPNDPSAPVLVYRLGKFFPKSNEPGGETSNADAPAAPLTPGSDSRTRVVMGMGPAVQGQRHMYEAEGWEKSGRPDTKTAINPFNKQWGAKLLSDVGEEGGVSRFLGLGAVTKPLARVMGGQQYQDYDQAAKSWEAAVLPVLSGAAVTPSEAERQIRANLPELGDTPQTLSRKATNRAMMTNSAADLSGKPRPFPKVGTWDFKGTQPASQPREPQGGAKTPHTYSDAAKEARYQAWLKANGSR